MSIEAALQGLKHHLDREWRAQVERTYSLIKWVDDSDPRAGVDIAMAQLYLENWLKCCPFVVRVSAWQRGDELHFEAWVSLNPLEPSVRLVAKLPTL